MKIKALHIVSLLLLLLPPVVLAIVFWKYAVNIPHWDDHALKSFQVNFNKSSFLEKIQLVFAQHNEHRIALTRFFSLLIYEIKGTMDYRWLMVLGNFSLLFIFEIFFVVFKKYKVSVIYFVPVSFILFGLQLHENLFWGMAAVQNFWVVFLAILTFYLLLISENKYAFWWAIFSSFLAINTSGNGFLVPIIGVLILLYQHRKCELIYWLSMSCVFILIYFYHYQPSPDAGKTNAHLGDWKNILKGIFIYFGAAVDSIAILPQKRQDWAMLSGLLLSAFGLLFFRKAIFKKYNLDKKKIDLFWLAILFFIAGTAAVVTYSRLGYGLDVLLGSKYKIYSTLFLVILYLVVLNLLKDKSQKIFGILAIFASILFNFYSYYADYQQVIFTKQERICDEFNWTYNPTTDPQIIKDFQKVYQPETRFYENDLKVLLNKIDVTNLKRNIFFDIQQDSTTIKVAFSQTPNVADEVYFILKSENHCYIYPVKQPIIPLKFNYLGRIANLEIPRIEIKTDKYQTGLMIKKANGNEIVFSPQLIDIQGVTLKEIEKNW